MELKTGIRKWGIVCGERPIGRPPAYMGHDLTTHAPHTRLFYFKEHHQRSRQSFKTFRALTWPPWVCSALGTYLYPMVYLYILLIFKADIWFILLVYMADILTVKIDNNFHICQYGYLTSYANICWYQYNADIITHPYLFWYHDNKKRKNWVLNTGYSLISNHQELQGQCQTVFKAGYTLDSFKPDFGRNFSPNTWGSYSGLILCLQKIIICPNYLKYVVWIWLFYCSL